MTKGEEIHKGFRLTVTEQPTGGFRAEIHTIPAGRSLWTMTFPAAFEAMAAARKIIDYGVMGYFSGGSIRVRPAGPTGPKGLAR
jgi:hypothetical protein